MPRKNSRVRRANQRGRYADVRIGVAPQRQVPRISLEQMVLPDGQCSFRTRRPKARFDTEEKAATALKQAQHERARLGSTYVEKRYYACPEGGCGGWHLSSREAFEERPWKPRNQPGGNQ